jgi:long-chain acyl-CoA synthetase
MTSTPAAPRTDAETASWWQAADSLSRFIADKVAGDLARLRPGERLPPPASWQQDMELGHGGLGMDSLELVTVATSLTEVLHLHRSGIEDYLLMHRRLGDWTQIAARGLSVFDAELTFHTSGSTGTPKPCRHTLAGLEAEIRAQARHLGPVRRVIGMVPCHHIYGFLFTILLPRFLDISFVEARGRMPGRVAAEMEAGDLLVAVPEQWALIARTGPADLTGRAGLCSTGPLAPDLFTELIGRGLSLTEIYGSSETAGIGWRCCPDEPFTLLEGLSLSADGSRLDRDWQGQGQDLLDRVTLSGNGQFRLRGRRDSAVQVGGVNVFPEQVAARLRQHPDVTEAAVRPMTISDGLRLKAFIVPASAMGAESLRTRLTDWAQMNLKPEERPKSWTFGPALPTSALGKLCDW